MSDERKRLDELLKRLIQERIENMLFITEDENEETSGEQLSWLSGQGGQEVDAKNRAYLDDDMHQPWDERISELGTLLAAIALDVIDHYKGKPGFTKEAAKREILEAIEVPLDIFYGKQPPITMGHFYSLDDILEEEFEDMNEETGTSTSTGQIGTTPREDNEDPEAIGEISENISTNRDDGEEEYESNIAAEAIAALEKMHQNLEGIIAKLKEAPNAPLGTDIAMAYSSLDEALTHLQRRK